MMEPKKLNHVCCNPETLRLIIFRANAAVTASLHISRTILSIGVALRLSDLKKNAWVNLLDDQINHRTCASGSRSVHFGKAFVPQRCRISWSGTSTQLKRSNCPRVLGQFFQLTSNHRSSLVLATRISLALSSSALRKNRFYQVENCSFPLV